MANSLLKELFTPSVESHEEVATAGFGIDSVEHASMEMMEAAAEVEQHEQALVELQEIATGLESIQESLQVSLEQGGLDPVAAQFAHHAVGAYTERLGIEAADQLPALESFGGDTGRQSSTEVSLESVGQTLSNIFEAVRRAIEAIIKAVTDFFTKLFSNAEKLESAVVATQKKVSDAKGSPKDKTRVPNAGVIAYQGKVDASSVASGMAKTNTAYNIMTNEYLKAATSGQKELMSALKDHKSVKEDDRSAVTKFWDNLRGKQKDLTVKVKGIESKLKGDISGGRTFKVETAGEGDAETVTVSFVKSEGGKDDVTNEIDTPNKGDLDKMLAEAKKLASNLKDSKKTINDSVDAYKEVHKVTEELNKDAKGGRIGKFMADANSRRAVSVASKNMVQPVQQLSSHVWSVTRGAIAMAEASLKNYEESK